MNLDLDPVIINPIQPLQDGDFIELNDLQGNEQVHYLLQQDNEVYQLNPQEQELMALADEIHQGDEAQAIGNNSPVIPASPIYLQVDEVPFDQLIGSEDEQEENLVEQMDQDMEQANQPGQADIQAVQIGAQVAIQDQDQIAQAGNLTDPSGLHYWQQNKAVASHAGYASLTDPSSIDRTELENVPHADATLR